MYADYYQPPDQSEYVYDLYYVDDYATRDEITQSIRYPFKLTYVFIIVEFDTSHHFGPLIMNTIKVIRMQLQMTVMVC